MTPLEILRISVLVSCALIIRTSILVVPLFGVLYILFIIFKDEFLSQHIFLTLTLTTVYGFTSCLLILSKLCQLRKQPNAEHKPIEELRDSDLKYENESEEEPHYELSYHWKNIVSTLKNFIFKNPYEFCKFRPVYGMILLTGLAFASIIVISMKHYRTEMDDVYCIGLKTLVPTALLISLVYFISNARIYRVLKCNDVYKPFDEYVQLPMKFLVTKAVAIFITGGGTYCFLVILIISIMFLSIVSSNYLYHTSKLDGALQSILPPIFSSPQRFLSTIFILVILGCVNALIGMMVDAFIEAKQSFLCIIEKNWQRNFGAICFLLPDTEFENLQAVKTALEHKKSLPLTEKEEIAFHYISWPIWRTKPPFMLQNFERDAPASESSDGRESDESDKSENDQKPDYPADSEPMVLDRDQPKVERKAVELKSEQLHEVLKAPKKLKELARLIAIPEDFLDFPEQSSSTDVPKEVAFHERPQTSSIFKLSVELSSKTGST